MNTNNKRYTTTFVGPPTPASKLRCPKLQTKIEIIKDNTPSANQQLLKYKYYH